MLINQTNVPKFIKGTRDIKKVNTLLKFSFFCAQKLQLFFQLSGYTLLSGYTPYRCYT